MMSEGPNAPQPVIMYNAKFDVRAATTEVSGSVLMVEAVGAL
jgi:hypothetical protein